MAWSRKFVSVVLLGLAFMLVFTAFQTMGNIQKTILSSISDEDPSYNGNGYTSLSIIYAVFAICNWLAPSVISVSGPRIAMVIGAFTYLLFILNFLLPKAWILYVASVVVGVGAALIWTGQGNYLTLNSNANTISRNSGIFWAILQLSMFIGNVFVYYQFEGLEHIDKGTRDVVIWVLSGIAAVGIAVFVMLPPIRPSEGEDATPEEINLGPFGALKGAGQLFITKQMILLTVTFFYTGIELGFFSGVYGSSIGFTKNFGEQAKQLVGLNGILIGVGEVIGGAAFGILGAKTIKWGRDPIVLGGFVIHAVCYFLIFLNLPNASPIGETDDSAFITSSAPLAVFCSFLLGFGDACFNTQVFSILGDEYSDNSAPAFAIFKFVQSVASAINFGYASVVGLYIQLAILFVFAILGTLTFVYVEWNIKKARVNEATT